MKFSNNIISVLPFVVWSCANVLGQEQQQLEQDVLIKQEQKQLKDNFLRNLQRYSNQDEQSDSTLETLEILLKFYDETRGLTWDNHTDWLVSEDYCDWYGITCYDTPNNPRTDGHVQYLDLADNHLIGAVPIDIFNLPYMEDFIVRDNADLSIDFKPLSDLPVSNNNQLRRLVISDTNVNDLTGIAYFRNLHELHITNLKINANLNKDIFTLKKLTGIYANYNKFFGSIPAEIGNLRSLRELFLYENELTGQIPDEFSALTKLEILALAANSFDGTMPSAALDQLTNLQILAIAREKDNMKGKGISGTLPSLSQHADLTEVYFENQLLSGEIPDNFLQSSPSDEVLTIDLTNNKIEGGVPDSLVDKSRMKLYLADNLITDVSTDFCDMIQETDWMNGDVSSLKTCDAFLCPPGTYSEAIDGEGRQTSKTDPCTQCDENLQNDILKGVYGLTTCDKYAGSGKVDEREVLTMLYNSMGGNYWRKKDNWLSFEEDICEWHGIECDTTTKQITSIRLKDNDLSKTPPPEIWTLPKLQTLDLSGNSLDGFTFEGSQYAKSLTFLDLTKTDLDSLDGIENLSSTSIEVLRLSSNYLEFALPKELFSLSTLKELYISHNKLIGSIPVEFGNLVRLERFSCYGNDMTGQIPATVGNLINVKELIMSENKFTGSLPPTINNLVRLETLSIHQTTSNAGITGELPAFEQLKKLTQLHLDSNKLQGQLPANLLLDTERGEERIEILLSDNSFSGSIPSDYAERFDQLVIDLTGNKIDTLSPDFCTSVGDWMDGSVADYTCDALMCKQGTYNEYGRVTNDDDTCRPCEVEGGAKYFGSKTCTAGSNDETGSGGGTVDTSDGNDERAIVKALYYTTNGPQSWNKTNGWITSNDHCTDWIGVECNSNGQIVKIDLSDNGLQGFVPGEVFNLPMLEELDLEDNDITVSLDNIGNAKSLQVLYLSNINLQSIVGIGAAKSLVTLHVTNNDIDEPLPDELFDLTNLKQLFMNYNRFSGRIPSGIERLTNLEELYLLHNRLEGQIPASIGELKELRVLSLTENDFSGTLPIELELLSNMEILAIQRESQAVDSEIASPDQPSWRSGTGLSGSLLSFSQMPNLQMLYLGVNSFTGSIPANFLDGVADKSLEITVDLVSNQLEGALPASLVDFDALTIYVAGNKISSIPPGLCILDNWMKGSVADFGCDAIVCPPNEISPYGRQVDNNGTQCIPCENGKASPYYGGFECSSASDQATNMEREILRGLYFATDGDNWQNKDNWVEAEKSICEWKGITCVSQDQESVQSIHLKRNGLKGFIPKEIFLLPNLEEINFASNEIDFSFDGIENAKKLEYLNLDEIGLKSLKGLDKATSKIKLLHMTGNDLGGVFPTELFSLVDLEVLYLSNNDVAGNIPDDLQNLQNMIFLACSECGLTGPIPSWISKLSSLEFLRMGGNSLTGQIPAGLDQLVKLKHLDLSDQTTRGGGGLTGGLPDFADLTNLAELALSRNKLDGSIPDKFLQSVDVRGTVEVDLRHNGLSGSIPVNLTHISDLKLYLGDNKITAVPPEICSTTWNGGNPDPATCDFILCPTGTYNSLGRATSDAPCQPCENDPQALLYLGYTQCGSDTETAILIEMYNALGGPHWTNSEGWLEEPDKCDWFGVTCNNTDGSMDSIVLPNNNMVGDLPTSFWGLTSLTWFEPSSNKVNIDFTGIENMVNLETLYLSEMGLTSIAGISKAPALWELHLTNNQLSGPIPEELFDITTLEWLYLNYNRFSGPLPTRIGELTALEELFLFHNDMTGTIPAEIGALTNIVLLSLGENKFTGPLPDALNTLSNLEVLSLQKESGIGPMTNGKANYTGLTGPLLSFDGLPYLRELYLGSNDLTGTIPKSFLSGVDKKKKPLVVDLTLNELEGEIPAQLTKFDDMKLYLAGNKISGISEEICKMDKWMDGEVANSCDSIMCPPGTFNSYGRRVGDDKPCETCAYDTSNYYGTLQCTPPAEELSEREILRRFYAETGGNDWFKRINWDEDDEDICQWHGVVCRPGDDTVVKIELKANNLVGTVPPIIFHLPNLEVLNLESNNIDVTFLGIEAAYNLKELHLQKTGLQTLKGIGAATKLTTLRVEETSIGGDIPLELFSLTSLRYLYISECGFGGPLPPKIGNLDKLVEFQCHGNDISGEIPPAIGKLTDLELLFLSENNFYGTLPPALNKLTSLKSLYLDSFTRNTAGISGPLLSFASLPKLRDLKLSDNSLTGTIPANLLKALDNVDDPVNIMLKNNQLTGVLPAGDLLRYGRVNIDITGNKITGMNKDVCQMWDWQDELVDDFGCDAILCPAGTYNQYGRQSSAGSPCVRCSGASPYLGSTVCAGMQKDEEKEILKKFYEATGGDNWHEKDGWMDDDVDICKWFGVSCKEGLTVESILLGSNNLVGTPPKELFQLENLKFLWLYSNPIDFKFDGIEHARKLTSLLLDSTGLKSLAGIGKGNSLVDVDVRFNKLSGPIPDEEIRELRNLESFLAGNNDFTGSIPSFATNRRLNTLRLDHNRLTGPVPLFTDHRDMKALDLSDNRLSGSIPEDLLQHVDVTVPMFIDLSSNALVGVVPGELARFDELTIYLRDNKIEGLHDDLCQQESFNGGDVNLYQCDGLLCPPKFYAENTGRATKDGTECLPCDLTDYYGASQCSSYEDIVGSSPASRLYLGISVALMLVAATFQVLI